MENITVSDQEGKFFLSIFLTINVLNVNCRRVADEVATSSNQVDEATADSAERQRKPKAKRKKKSAKTADPRDEDQSIASNSEAEDVQAPTASISKKKKPCECGRTDHEKVTSSKCPLYKARQGAEKPPAPDGFKCIRDMHVFKQGLNTFMRPQYHATLLKKIEEQMRSVSMNKHFTRF